MKPRQAILALVGAILIAAGGCTATSRWVYANSSGKLAYRALPTGDHIMDFSYAGYRGGGVAIPNVPAKITVYPGGDDAANIQSAIDQVSRLPLENGQRGAVLLASGTFNCDRTIFIHAGGVVLRGTGGTVLNLIGKPHVGIIAAGKAAIVEQGQPTLITEAYVPSGTTTFNVASSAGWRIGDTIQITRPVTAAWVHFMEMDNLVRNGKPQRWLAGKIQAYRVIAGISGNAITVTIPLSDDYDVRYLNPPGTSVVKVNISGLISEVGIEHLRIVSPPQPIQIAAPQFNALKLNDVTDAWARDLDIHDTFNSTDVGDGSSRVTMLRIHTTHSVVTLGAALPMDFGDHGTQVLYDHCTAAGGHQYYFATFGRTQGPNVLLNCTFTGDGRVQPHQRWSTGLLIDNCQADGIDLMNRGIMGSGHGWTMGWGVLWNCTAKTFVVQEPPGTENWEIGCVGTPQLQARPFDQQPKLPPGIVESTHHRVTPRSLYLEQLRQRLGDDAVKNIGY